MCMYQTCDAGRRLEVWRARQGHRRHSKGIDLSWGLHRRGVLCWRSEVDLIIKVIFKLLRPHMYKFVDGMTTKKKPKQKTLTLF